MQQLREEGVELRVQVFGPELDRVFREERGQLGMLRLQVHLSVTERLHLVCRAHKEFSHRLCEMRDVRPQRLSIITIVRTRPLGPARVPGPARLLAQLRNRLLRPCARRAHLPAASGPQRPSTLTCHSVRLGQAMERHSAPEWGQASPHLLNLDCEKVEREALRGLDFGKKPVQLLQHLLLLLANRRAKQV